MTDCDLEATCIQAIEGAARQGFKPIDASVVITLDPGAELFGDWPKSRDMRKIGGQRQFIFGAIELLNILVAAREGRAP